MIIGGGAYFILKEDPIEQPHVDTPSANGEAAESADGNSGTTQEQYKFFLHKDSHGGDIEQIAFVDPGQMQQACSTRDGCKAFNTSGWLKKAVKPMEEWNYNWHSSEPEAGLWVKDSVAANLSGYYFIKGADSGGGDIKKVDFTNAADMQAQCNTIDGCQGFNVAGYMKNAIKPVSDFTKKAGYGTYIKANYLDIHTPASEQPEVKVSEPNKIHDARTKSAAGDDSAYGE